MWCHFARWGHKRSVDLLTAKLNMFCDAVFHAAVWLMALCGDHGGVRVDTALLCSARAEVAAAP